MKKLLLLPLILLSFLLLTSCSNEPTLTHKDAFENKETYNLYLKDVKFEDEPIKVAGQEIDKKATRIEVYLPANVKESTRTVVSDVESFYTNPKYDKFVSTTLSFANLSNVSATLLNTISTENKKIKEAYTACGFELPESYVSTWNLQFDKNQIGSHQAKEGYNRVVAAAYLPVRVEYYVAKKDSNAVNTLSTFILLPIAHELTYVDANGKLVSDSKFNKFDTFALNVDEFGNLK